MTDAIVYLAFIITADEPEVMIYAFEGGKLKIIELLPVSSVTIEPIE